MPRTLSRSKAALPAWAKAAAPKLSTPAPVAAEEPSPPQSLPWRRRVAGWPDDWRERWGRTANALEDAGLGWRDAEERAWAETLKARREEERDGLSKMRVGSDVGGGVHQRAPLREAELF